MTFTLTSKKKSYIWDNINLSIIALILISFNTYMYMIIKWPLTGFFAVFEEQMETFSVKSFSNSLYIVTSYYMPTHYHKQQQNTICNRVKKVWQKKRESEFCLFPLLSSLIRQYIASISGIMGNLNSGRIWEIYTYIFFSLHKCDVTFQ